MEPRETTSTTSRYEKPEVESEEVFETLALACSKTDPQCPATAGINVAQS